VDDGGLDAGFFSQPPLLGKRKRRVPTGGRHPSPEYGMFNFRPSAIFNFSHSSRRSFNKTPNVHVSPFSTADRFVPAKNHFVRCRRHVFSLNKPRP